MNAILYLRVSSASQLDGFGLDVQENTCRAYAKAHGLRVVGVYHGAPDSAVDQAQGSGCGGVGVRHAKVAELVPRRSTARPGADRRPQAVKMQHPALG